MLKLFFCIISLCALTSYASIFVMHRQRAPIEQVDRLVLRALGEPATPDGDNRRLIQAEQAIALMGAAPWNHYPFMLAGYVHHQRGEYPVATQNYHQALVLLDTPQHLRTGIPFRTADHLLDRNLLQTRLKRAEQRELPESTIACNVLHPSATRQIQHARMNQPPPPPS